MIVVISVIDYNMNFGLLWYLWKPFNMFFFCLLLYHVIYSGVSMHTIPPLNTDFVIEAIRLCVIGLIMTVVLKVIKKYMY